MAQIMSQASGVDNIWIDPNGLSHFTTNLSYL
jgi:hypothetical protein